MNTQRNNFKSELYNLLVDFQSRQQDDGYTLAEFIHWLSWQVELEKEQDEKKD
jgi:hypothetical protein